MRSFSNLWYWIALAVTWSRASHWVLGVPWDMVSRARREGGSAAEDMEALLMIQLRRIDHILASAGLALTAAGSAFLTFLGLAGFLYGVQFCQALFLLMFPLALVALLSARNGARLLAAPRSGPPLYSRLAGHRLAVQAIGLCTIFITALWGMLQNIHYSVL